MITEMLNITTGILDRARQAPTIEGVMEREEKLNLLEVNYRKSPIMVDKFTNAEPGNVYLALDESELVAGYRAPGAPGLVVVSSDVETRLFDVFSPIYHTAFCSLLICRRRPISSRFRRSILGCSQTTLIDLPGVSEGPPQCKSESSSSTIVDMLTVHTWQ